MSNYFWIFISVVMAALSTPAHAELSESSYVFSSCVNSDLGVKKDVLRRVQQLPKPKPPEGLEAQIQKRFREDFKQQDEEIQGVKVPRVPEPTVPVKIPQVFWSTQGREVLLCKAGQQFILALVLKEKVGEFLKGGSSVMGSQVMLYGPASRPVVIVHE